MTPGSAPGPDAGSGPLDFAPDPAEFAALAKEHAIVPVWCEVVADTLTPVACFANVVGEGNGFLFESVEGGERWGRYSFVGRRPLATLTARGRTVEPTGRLGLERSDAGILAAVEALVPRFRSPALSGLPPLHGGLVGYLGYDVVREVERLPDPPPDDLGHPDAALVVIGQFCAFDHWRQRIVLVDNVVVPEAPDGLVDEVAVQAAYEAACAADRAGGRLRPVGAGRAGGRTTTGARDGGRHAHDDVGGVQGGHRRRQGVHPCRRHLPGRTLAALRPRARRRSVRRLPVAAAAQPQPLPVLPSFPGGHRRGRVPRADGAPARRHRDLPSHRRLPAAAESEQHDRLLEGELEDPKELAEHIMLVDLARNDVGRVVRFGTEKVDELMTIERYSHIMHITSQVSGELADDKGPIDVLRATLPAGTLSGAPKVRAMEIIDELEPSKRGVYGGVVGYIDFSGNLDTAIAIRTMVVTPDGRASVQAGAGIVADSDPQSEDEECAHKAGALLVAVTAARRMRAARQGQ